MSKDRDRELTRISRGPRAGVRRLRELLGAPSAIAWDFTGPDEHDPELELERRRDAAEKGKP